MARLAIAQPISRSFVRWRRRTHLWRTLRVASLLLRTLYIMNRERSRVMHARARGEYDARPDVEALVRVMREFRRTAVDLGGLLIKWGQFLGARADLLPPEALNELASLHDEVTPESFDDLRVVIERELHAPLEAIFAAVDPCPAGSASLGQVHRARLKDGREVAVKIQRPGIAEIVRTDLSTLRWVLELVRRLAPAADRVMDLRALYREFSRTVYEELDYVGEGRNAERFARVFADDPLIGAPGVIWDHSSRRVLTLEWVNAIKIARTAELDAAGVDRDALAKQLVRFYFRQVLEVGYYHADPHPGNIFVKPTPRGPRLIFVDFGMMGDVTPRIRAGMRDCFSGVVQKDAALVVHGLESLGFLSEVVDHEALEHLIGVLLARFSTLPLSHLREVDPREIMGDLGTVLYDQPLRLPSRFAFFGRAIGMLMGLSATLSEDFNFAEVAAPYAREFLKRGGLAGVLGVLGIQSVEGLGREALRESLSMARTLAAFPRRVDRLLARAERGELHFVVEHRTGDTSNNGRGGRQLLVNPLKRPVPAWVPLGLVAAIAITQMVRRRDSKSR